MSGETMDRRQQVQQRALRLLQAAAVLLRSARTHSLANDALVPPLEHFSGVVAEIVRAYADCEFLLSGTMCVLNSTIVSPDLQMLSSVRELSDDLKLRNVGGFRVRVVPTITQTRALAEALLEGRTGVDEHHQFEALHAHEIDARLRQLHAQELASIADRDPAQQAIELYAALVQLIEGLVSSVRTGDDERATRVTSRILRELLDTGARAPRALVQLAMLRDRRIPYLQRHLVSTTLLATLVGFELGMPRGELLNIAEVALFHELGMAAYGAHLETSGKDLPPADRQLIKDLPLLSARLVLRRKGLDLSVLRSVVGAVECKRSFDDPVAAEKNASQKNHTTLAARIVQVCSMFDALTSDRSFRAAMPIPQALQQLTEGNMRLDPRVIIALANVLVDPDRLVGRALKRGPGEPRNDVRL